MSGAIPCQFIASTSFSRLSTLNPLRFHIFSFRLQSILPLLLGGCLLFISDSTQAYAQIKTGEVLLTQRVYQDLPPPPNVPVAPYGEEPLPQVPTAEPFSTSPQNSVEFRAPSNQYNQNFGRYQVYVYGSNLRRQLPEVRDIVPDAFIKRLGRREVIQAGVFRSESGARDRARQLQSRGIGNTRIASYNGQDIPNYPDTGNSNGYPGGDYGGNRSNNYYVVIPTKLKDLPRYRYEIKRYVRRPDVAVIPRDEPRGPHVAVGPFAKRWLAEEWNNYLRRDPRFGNARVYYGK
ncbi:hypothetical protein NIES4073_56360 [Kalymmatonema gypsitolerans NIES-4073]|nr:hypothetical protein NIES4073_56360 [Scytonema sp. NIES-4073]